MNPLLSALSTAGDLLDMPGSYLRGALSGRPGERASGREMLQNWGVAGENQPGLDFGDVAGFGAEALLDPLSLAAPALGAIKGLRGIQAGTKAAQGLAHADDASPLVKAMAGFAGEESGALRPFMEIGRRTDPDYINSVPWWHGTATPGLTPQSLDPMKTDPGGLFGRGIYKTADPNIAGGPGGYAKARMEQGLGEWERNAFGAVSGQAKDNPELQSRIVASLGGLLDAPGFMGGDPAKLKYLRDSTGHWLERGHPGHYMRSFLNNMGSGENEISAVSDSLGKLGVSMPPVPRPTVYEANTNLGKILDLDVPPPPDVMEIAHALMPEQRRPIPPPLHASTLIEKLAQFNAREADIGGVIADQDPLIQSLRGMGYDALSHTGGLRAGGGRNLHQVLISLDPNDTISRVGRSGQITKFEPQDIKALLERFAP